MPSLRGKKVLKYLLKIDSGFLRALLNERRSAHRPSFVELRDWLIEQYELPRELAPDPSVIGDWLRLAEEENREEMQV